LLLQRKYFEAIREALLSSTGKKIPVVNKDHASALKDAARRITALPRPTQQSNVYVDANCSVEIQDIFVGTSTMVMFMLRLLELQEYSAKFSESLKSFMAHRRLLIESTAIFSSSNVEEVIPESMIEAILQQPPAQSLDFACFDSSVHPFLDRDNRLSLAQVLNDACPSNYVSRLLNLYFFC
jgi:hypothetical protein